jgi:hypothetical protein
VGWLAAISWQTWAAAGSFIVGGSIQDLLILNYGDEYTPQRWQVTLLAIATVSCAAIINGIWARWLPLLDRMAVVLHVAGFLAILITVWSTSPRADSRTVLLGFENHGGWSTAGVRIRTLCRSASGSRVLSVNLLAHDHDRTPKFHQPVGRVRLCGKFRLPYIPLKESAYES